MSKVVQDHLGKTYRSIKEMASEWDVPYQTCLDRIGRGWSIKETLTKQVESGRKGSQTLVKDHAGNTYKTVTDMCRDYGIKPVTFYARIKRGMTIKEALITPVEVYREHKVEEWRDLDGKLFSSQAKLCKSLSCNPSYYRYLRGSGLTHIEALERIKAKQQGEISNNSIGEEMVKHVLDQMGVSYSNEKKLSDLNITLPANAKYYRFDFWFTYEGFNCAIEYDGKQHFKNNHSFTNEGFGEVCFHDDEKNKLCENNNIKLLRIRFDQNRQITKLLEMYFGNLQSQGWWKNSLLGIDEYYSIRDIPVDLNIYRKNKEKKVQDHKGNWYKSRSSMARFYGINDRTLRDRLKKGERLESALTRSVGFRKQEKITRRSQRTKKVYTDHLGNKFPTKTEMCRAYGITLSILKSRQKRGWTLENALSTPIGKWGGNSSCGEKIDEYIQEYVDGHITKKEIAMKLGVTPEAVYKRFRGADYDKKRKKKTEDNLARLMDLAKEFDCAGNTELATILNWAVKRLREEIK